MSAGGLCIHQRFFMNSVMTESFAELFEQSQANLAKLKPGAIVKGIVVDVQIGRASCRERVSSPV